MKLDCGLSSAEKARLVRKEKEAKLKRDSKWHKWFAWFPVRVGHRDCRWLEYVERRDSNVFENFGGYSRLYLYKHPMWEYRVG